MLSLRGPGSLHRRIVVLVVLAALVGACNGSESEPTSDGAPSTTSDNSPTTSDNGPSTSDNGPTTVDSTTTTSDTPSDTTVGEEGAPLDSRLAWLAEAFTTGEVTESEYQATFTADFINSVSHDEFMSVVRQLADGRQWSVGEFEDREGLSGTARIVASDGEEWRANMSLETVPPYRISGLLIQPTETPELEDPPDDFEEAAARLGELGDLELAVMEVVDGECEPVFESGEGEPAPVGSAIKLYVLGAVADAVAEGGLSWDDETPIVEEHRSIPTGILQDEEVGEAFSVREMAETMIAFSDNTATDHLIGLVGRDRVEAALEDYGMEDPGRNIPFMDTMDLGALKVGPAAGLATQWLDGDEEERRQILEQVSELRPSDLPLAEFTDPVMPDQIGWFATPSDMCRVLVDLYDQGEPLTQILTINPGIPDDENRFDVVAFKGGSEPGLVAMNWLVELPGGGRFVVSGSVVNGEETFDQLEATLLFGAVRDLVADR